MDFVKTYGLVAIDDDDLYQAHYSVKATNELDAIILMCKQMNKEIPGEDDDYDGSYGYVTDGTEIYQYGGVYPVKNADFPMFDPFKNPYINPDNGEFDKFSKYLCTRDWYVKPCYTAKINQIDKEIGCYENIEGALRNSRYQAKKEYDKLKKHHFDISTIDTFATIYDPFGDKVGYIDVNGITYKKNTNDEFIVYSTRKFTNKKC